MNRQDPRSLDDVEGERSMADPTGDWKAADLAFRQAIMPPAYVIAVGAGGLLFGSLIAGLSEGGLTPGLVIMSLGAPVLVAGAVWAHLTGFRTDTHRLDGRHWRGPRTEENHAATFRTRTHACPERLFRAIGSHGGKL